MATVIVGHPQESNQMSLAFEKGAFDPNSNEAQQLSCTLVTGFLGSGKTTLVQHIQRQRGNLRVAVLVNDFADVDIDSFLLDQSQTNAALGIPTVRLASGCACCTIRGKFSEAVKAIRASSHHFDHLIVETSGISDPLPIATLLESEGVPLHLIVTLVDADCLPKILLHPIAKRQLSLADLVLVNKCDLVSLSQLSDVEDRLESELGSGTRVVRTKFCRVPLDLILDVAPRQVAPPLTATSANSSEGVLSHEASAPSLPPPLPPGESRGGRKGKRTGSLVSHVADPGGVHSASYFSSAVFDSSTPLSLPRFQSLVQTGGAFREASGLLRVKGHLWLAERRRDRFVFQLSGRQRCETLCTGQWESTPTTCLVLIGRDRAELESLKRHLAECAVYGEAGAGGREGIGGGAEGAIEFCKAVGEDKRFRLFSPKSCEGEEAMASSVVEFGLVGNSLRGVQESALNATCMLQVNGRGKCFLTGTVRTGEDVISARTCDLRMYIDKQW